MIMALWGLLLASGIEGADVQARVTSSRVAASQQVPDVLV
jgi:hypothetical protein